MLKSTQQAAAAAAAAAGSVREGKRCQLRSWMHRQQLYRAQAQHCTFQLHIVVCNKAANIREVLLQQT
jgi:hypothetical protein